MLLAEEFSKTDNTGERYRRQAFGPRILPENKVNVQFASNDPAEFLEAALKAQELGAAAVDLNLGCPQRRAKENHYGAYMTDPPDWQLCCDILKTASSHERLTIPVTVKIRLQKTLEETIEFATLLKNSGASLLAIHGRHRGSEDRRRDGSADLDAIAVVVASLSPFPVLTNGNVRCPEDVNNNLSYTKAAGIMVAEELLRDPALFAPAGMEAPRRGVDLAEAYCKVCESCGLKLDDGSRNGKNGNQIRGEAGEGDEEFERFSVWWTNAESVKGHLKNMLGSKGDLTSRRTFKKAEGANGAIRSFRRRFSIK
ncbi:hypothetical protein TL16_g01438 [Triparma laevis f. inornata]|uniref:tRNA-dihydrouridine(16/17) synthase [NAD(P)(+)] n=2 Tax=Triparma laevis TaxID=1534972 RepID=A0A9W7F558_9STRA|nr:hypothetical protein TL16_g01438 [Triparma laevis f. inornata]GMI03895.1 hypothetical protein TrLO_g6679 [Triparma laevis f. longispina]